MVHLIYFYSNTVLCGLDIIGYIEFEAAEHAYYIFFFPYLMSINPYVCTIVNSIEVQPYFFVFILLRQSEGRAIPIRFLPRIFSIAQVTVFS